MTETEWQVEEVTCEMCGTRSVQTVAPVLEGDGPLDLEGRPGEPLRSALPFKLGRCPNCGYVGCSGSLWAPDERAPRMAIAGLLESKAYRALSRDAALPVSARTYLCRAWIDSVLGDPTHAFTGAQFAAWACDDHDLEAAARALREQAVVYWELARDIGEPTHAECATGVSEAIHAEMLRRLGRFDESVECAASARAFPGLDDGVGHAISYIADRAARGDREAHNLEDAFEDRDGELDPRLISAVQGIQYRRTLISGSVRGLLPRTRACGQPEDAIVFDGGGYYVQILVRPETLQIYAEAVDLDAQGAGVLSDAQRELLDRLGWERGGEDDVTTNYHRVFAGEAADGLASDVADVLEYTLRLVYGADAASALDVTVITYDRAIEEAGNGDSCG